MVVSSSSYLPPIILRAIYLAMRRLEIKIHYMNDTVDIITKRRTHEIITIIVCLHKTKREHKNENKF